ncbi:MAG: alpha/beta fold hydrolase [Thermonemataceae bacterium]
MRLYTHQSLSLHYARTGQGERTLLAFHGFGQEAVSFSRFLTSLESYYTIYSFHWLPQNDPKPPSSATWQAWLTSFCQQENILRFDLLVFSIFARWIWPLACLPTLPID